MIDKKDKQQTKGVTKGAPSGFMISLLIHGAAFLLAGALVVFNIVQPEPAVFQPPPPERPKMKLKKPKVKVKQQAKPKASTKIVTKMPKASMPDLQLPEMSGMGDSLGTDVGGFDLMPDMDSLSILGSSQTIGADLEGTYYDFKRDRNGRGIIFSQPGMREAIIKFVESGWRPSSLARYYRADKKLYATCIVIPPTLSTIAPSAFGDKNAADALWMVHYKGKLSHSEGITFRFWCSADETILIRVGGKIVAGAKWESPSSFRTNVDPDTVSDFWRTSSADSRRYVFGGSRAIVGDWVTLMPGEVTDIEILIADNGGMAHFMLGVEEEGVEYEENVQGGPIVPAFKTAPISRDLQDVIYTDLVPGQVSLTNGPVFNDLATQAGKVAKNTEEQEESVDEYQEAGSSEMRVWTLSGGQTVEAEFMNKMADYAVLKSTRGDIKKVPLNQFSVEDLRYIQLATPPEFEVEFRKDVDQFIFKSQIAGQDPRPPEDRCHYGVDISQRGSKDYNYKIDVEFFAIGEERLGQKYILLDRQTTSFTPTEENDRSHSFMSKREVVLRDYIIQDEPRGETYFGYLIILKDERGKVIQVEASNDWLWENIDKLSKLHPGNYLDDDCNRVYPTQPPATRY